MVTIRQTLPEIMPVLQRGVPQLVVPHPFANQNGRVAIGDVDGKQYFADECFFVQCAKEEVEREGTIPLYEDEVIFCEETEG